MNLGADDYLTRVATAEEVLSAINARPNSEIATILGCAENTIKGHLARAPTLRK
jgi:DNA-binding CsgD family transcriptional regulator